jgi:hypothetical protein
MIASYGYLFAFVAVPASTKSAGFEQLPIIAQQL